MVRVSGGCFQMGSPDSDTDHQPNERQHQVCVQDFSIGKYEVTQAEWQTVMGDNPSHFKGARLPVEGVIWNDVQDFIAKLNARTGKHYRLPTEAEWEYACRSGGKPERYCGGDDLDGLAWYDNNSGGTTHSVGQKHANGLGLYDMSGNVWEWTCSAYDADYGGDETRCASASLLSVTRGGSCFNEPEITRSAYRSWSLPGFRGSTLGFRLAQSARSHPEPRRPTDAAGAVAGIHEPASRPATDGDAK